MMDNEQWDSDPRIITFFLVEKYDEEAGVL